MRLVCSLLFGNEGQRLYLLGACAGRSQRKRRTVPENAFVAEGGRARVLFEGRNLSA